MDCNWPVTGQDCDETPEENEVKTLLDIGLEILPSRPNPTTGGLMI